MCNFARYTTMRTVDMRPEMRFKFPYAPLGSMLSVQWVDLAPCYPSKCQCTRSAQAKKPWASILQWHHDANSTSYPEYDRIYRICLPIHAIFSKFPKVPMVLDQCWKYVPPHPVDFLDLVKSIGNFWNFGNINGFPKFPKFPTVLALCWKCAPSLACWFPGSRKKYWKFWKC